MSGDRPEPGLGCALPPVLCLVLLVGYGLVLRPLYFDLEPLPLEVVFPTAAALAAVFQRWLGYSWREIQDAVVDRLSRAMPGFFVLFVIGLLVGSWMVCGTIPMLICWGIEWLEPRFLYVSAFLLPALFSTMTGTSWGAAGTVGVVLMGVSGAIGADSAITAGAVIGGAYFGDKLSPLSDTTNMAALGAGVELFDHVRAMLWTTLPSASVAVAVYFAVGIWQIELPSEAVVRTEQSEEVARLLGELFRFHPLLLLPPAIVLGGSLWRMPTIPVLAAGVFSAALLGFALQPFELQVIAQALTEGVSLAALVPTDGDRSHFAAIAELLERGGLHSMAHAIFVAFLVFFYVGVLDCTGAMRVVVAKLFAWARGRAAIVLGALVAAATTNALTSNQYATSFLVGDAFGERFDRLGIPRRVLSRSIEDTGTMIESIVPWHPTALFMVATLGVEVEQYWRWQLLTLANLVIAPALAITGIGCRQR